MLNAILSKHPDAKPEVAESIKYENYTFIKLVYKHFKKVTEVMRTIGLTGHVLNGKEFMVGRYIPEIIKMYKDRLSDSN